MSKKQRTMAGILADLRASQTHLEEAMEGIELAPLVDVADEVDSILQVAKANILHAVERLIRADWVALWDLASVLKGPEEEP